MKDYRYANRGRSFEEFIRYANGRYERRQEAMVQKIPTEFIPLRDRNGKVYSVKVEHKSTVDYIGRYKQYPIAMEAKNTNADTIRWDAVQPHQAEFLDKFTKQPGTIGLVLVSFNLRYFYAIPWAFWGAAYDLRIRKNDSKTRRIITAHGQEWEIPQKKSCRIGDLLPIWQISGNDPDYGLNFLQNAKKYVIPG